MCAHLSGVRHSQKRFFVNGESRRFLTWSMGGLLKIGGKLTTERPKLEQGRKATILTMDTNVAMLKTAESAGFYRSDERGKAKSEAP
jgi:hypothetical protein